ncbi:AAA family ATPase [Shinella sp. HZN7]|uniref:AAA family ATPase n=1 Tax=Shinella sp. (strain HZN7) TaxID=879274 RepID=UPI001FD9811C|nr:AAA family ATPase [Shinella sp. HZN7]
MFPDRFSEPRDVHAPFELSAGFRTALVLTPERHDGEVIELLNASSGELALISSLVFLISSIGQEPVILIDEPENSLHPRWQREYLEKIVAAAFTATPRSSSRPTRL